VGSRPALAAVAGALAIAFTGVLVVLAGTPPATAAFFRCLYALPLLGLLAWLEQRRFGALGRRELWLAWVAGAFFAADLELWHHAIAAVGAGLSTVIANLQVVVVGVVAWALLGERPSGRVVTAVPIALAGVVLISGVVGGDAYGDQPVLGVVLSLLTALAYAGFLLVLRAANTDLRRPAGPLFHATVSSTLALAAVGALLAELELPGWAAQGWLLVLGVSAQVFGYLAISISLPRLPAVVTSILLLVQPVLSVGIAALVVDERPSAPQLVGVALVIVGVLVAASAPRRARVEESAVTA
jgi:drug/metabolite transporter (DMT)-like permease